MDEQASVGLVLAVAVLSEAAGMDIILFVTLANSATPVVIQVHKVLVVESCLDIEVAANAS
ncbi:MAG: hypothetical protein K0S39_5746 [Paenibacillus sp.]|nr:hypothetical protein [Paenibacillus sp.]